MLILVGPRDGLLRLLGSSGLLLCGLQTHCDTDCKGVSECFRDVYRGLPLCELPAGFV